MYEKNKLRLNEIASAIQDFYFLVKFGLVLIYKLKVYRKKNSSILLRKNMFNSLLLHFSFEKRVPFQVFKDFSVENLENNPTNFLSKSFSEIYFSPIINYWSSIFTLYLTWEAFSLVCVLSIFFFLSFFFFFFLLVFSSTNANYKQGSSDWRRNHYFSSFPLLPAHEYSFSSSRFLPLLFNQSICNYETYSWWHFFSLEIGLLFPFSLM